MIYFNETSKGEFGEDKVADLIEDGARVVGIKTTPPPTFLDDLVCVIGTGTTSLAGYIALKEDFEFFVKTEDPRPKTYLVYENVKQFAK